MTKMHVGQLVQLMQNIPFQGLHRGEVGMVCSTWFEPTIAYEVEFQRILPFCAVRVLLMPSQISADTQAQGQLFAGERT